MLETTVIRKNVCAHRFTSDVTLAEAKGAYLQCIALRASDQSDLEVRAQVGVAKLDMVLGERWLCNARNHIVLRVSSRARATQE